MRTRARIGAYKRWCLELFIRKPQTHHNSFSMPTWRRNIVKSESERGGGDEKREAPGGKIDKSKSRKLFRHGRDFLWVWAFLDRPNGSNGPQTRLNPTRISQSFACASNNNNSRFSLQPKCFTSHENLKLHLHPKEKFKRNSSLRFPMESIARYVTLLWITNYIIENHS